MNGGGMRKRSIEIPVYNRTLESQHSLAGGKSGSLRDCEDCGRKYDICCICDAAEKDWNKMILEVGGVSAAEGCG